LDRARLTIQRFAAREIQGLGDALSETERRIRQREFADAIWHLATDPLKNTEENVKLMAQENKTLRDLGTNSCCGTVGPAAQLLSEIVNFTPSLCANET
jgi:hypothetical protein